MPCTCTSPAAPPGGASLDLTPKSHRVLLRGRLDDLDELASAYRGVEDLLCPVRADDRLETVDRGDFYNLLRTLNFRFVELLAEANDHFKGEQP